ncbi:MAG: V4R domain-containing protein [Promethearchaeati archaeon SRVP18_Atabeyarchaeia-1]
MARMQFEKLLSSPSKIGIREKLGDSVDLLSYQERMLGALSLSRSMGPILFEAGRRPATYMLEEMWPEVRKQPGFRSIADANNLEEARLSDEFTTLQIFAETTRQGLLTLSEFEKNKLIVVQVEECAICYGVGDLGQSVCYFLGGNIAGTLEGVLGRKVGFVESKCCAKGDPNCEFRYTV